MCAESDMNEENIACEILKSMDIAILRRIGPRTYDFFGQLPDFYREIFCDEEGRPSREPWTLSPMLDFFLEDVERFFEQEKTGTMASCMWQEDGKNSAENAFVSIAATYGDSQLLLIRMLEREYQEHVGMLRRARSQLLESRNLSSSLEYYRKKSRIDGLTKIFNKATFMDLLKDEIRRSIMLDYSLAFLLIDIDNFKHINDTYGHLVGDNVLETLGALLTDSLRKNDIVARFGGEEFTVLIPQVNKEQALNVACKLQRKIAETKFEGVPDGITVSIGCSLYIPRETIKDFIDRADVALYCAKTGGKNRTCVS